LTHPNAPVRGQQPKRSPFQLTRVAAACTGLALVAGVQAQQATAPAAPAQSVVVTGIRGSLETSLSLKRDAQGWVDGITAEDIGKFPDTNLAESLQRVSGVSIDRSIGEGSRITVRGAGPDHNLVLLNGRQMPASSIADTAASNSRAFDFANLASESISALEVYKTSRASTPTGGIGATVNIKTARPLESRGMVASVGIKGVLDRSNSRLPDAIQGSGITPEISGIYSNTFADGRFGVAISGSYQERDLGYNQAAVPGGWRPFKGDEGGWGTIPQPGAPGASDITNRPKAGDLYSVPQNLNYSVNGLQRQRTNGQLTLQFSPFKGLVTTLDHTYSENKIQTKRHELSAWFNFGPSVSSWTDGPVAAPKFYAETIVPGTSDIAMAGAAFATRNENRSTGLNVAWKASDRLRLELDAHSSTATSGADSPYGSNAVLGTASFNRGTTSVDFSRDFPVLGIANSTIDASLMQVTGSSFRNSYMKSAVDQVQVKGKWDLDDSSGLDFGVSLTKVKNRTAYGFVQRDTWGGATSPADYPDDLWKADTIRPYFSSISGSGSSALFNQFYTFDFEKVRAIASAAGGNPALYLPPTSFSVDSRVQEKSQSAFVQYNKGWEAWGLPMQVAAGLRYEKTDVTSTALVPTATGITWVANNEFTVLFGPPGFTTLTGSYNHVLPSIDFDVELRRDTKFRASYGESIGRPAWDAIQGGQTLNQLARLDGGTGSQGNPALKPLKSKNLDLSLEYYYAKASYAAVGVFVKNVDNYIGVGKTKGTPFNLTTPANGALYKEAVAQGCVSTDPSCIRNYIFTKYDGRNGVMADKNADGSLKTDTNGNLSGSIAGQPGDPVATFDITTQANQKSARIDGLEFNVQHMFGKSGFGLSANYTKVNSGLKYDNASRGDQFALVGLSDSANLVGFYENDKWSVRVAYNWRDKFLSGLTDGAGANPAYTEAYGQIDVSVGYNWNNKLSFQAEAINLNDGIQRVHGRAKEQVLYATQTGPRYMFGMRYKF
jgi:TonB-dependent receptor